MENPESISSKETQGDKKIAKKIKMTYKTDSLDNSSDVNKTTGYKTADDYKTIKPSEDERKPLLQKYRQAYRQEYDGQDKY